MADLPRPARIYIVVVLVVAAAAVVVTLILAPPRVDRAPLALLLLACATIAQQFKVKSPKHQSYYTTTIFFFAAALVLRPAYVMAIVIAAHAAELLRFRYRWYIAAFNVANLSKAGTLDLENLGTDVALMSIGALGALLLLSNPWLVPLTLGPLFLIYRSLLVPTLKEEARTDPKTELANMKHWSAVGGDEIDRARRFGRPLSVAIADLDLLRDINNRYGHLVGDQMIVRVAQAIRSAVRDYDLPARFGGDEFAILMPETTLPEALIVAERIRQGVQAIELRVSDGTRVMVSASIGVAAFPRAGGNASELLAAADRAVYQAKAQGRNQVCAFAEPADQLRWPRPAVVTTLPVVGATSSDASLVGGPHGRA
ncbi:MAG: GGDEF domain-containing protein [Chloroflexi bacterium]|nr:MAG: GGDEF domain-containing protein [Chloroflexota bacterium]